MGKVEEIKPGKPRPPKKDKNSPSPSPKNEENNSIKNSVKKPEIKKEEKEEKVKKKKRKKVKWDAHDPREHLNLVLIGHVDAGKSTISGQILLATNQIDERTINKFKN